MTDLLVMGTAFPLSPTHGDPFFRSDLGMWCSYSTDASGWITSAEYQLSIPEVTVSATTSSADYWIGDAYDIYYTRFEIATKVVTTNDGTHNWTIGVRWFNLAKDASAYVSTVVTSADSPDVYVDHSEAFDSPMGANKGNIRLTATKNNSPGNLSYSVSIKYRLIIT